jgi:hypothetical protein
MVGVATAKSGDSGSRAAALASFLTFDQPSGKESRSNPAVLA